MCDVAVFCRRSRGLCGSSEEQQNSILFEEEFILTWNLGRGGSRGVSPADGSFCFLLAFDRRGERLSF